MKSLKPILISLAGVAIIIMLLAGVKFGQIKTMIASGESFTQPPEYISVYAAEKQLWPNVYKAVGTVLADKGIVISAEVAGKVIRIYFSNGEQVKAGQILLEQDSSNEQAQLRAASARLTLAQSSYDRLVQLRLSNIAAQSDVDAGKQQLDSAQGEVDNLKATLEKKQIRAPFDGRIGIRLLDVGTDLQTGTSIVSLQATNKVKVNFQVPQNWLVKMEKGLPVSVSIAEGTVVLNGEIGAIGVEINTITRNATVQSLLDNSGAVLIPGMAVSASVTLSEPLAVLVVPNTSVIYAPFGDTVFVVEEDAKTGKLAARQQFVRLGKASGDYVEIIEGLKEGESVVSAGAFKLYNGQLVALSDGATPELKREPTPSDA
ncbi:MAG: membrane fusion protein (multidrug efflux system) [Lentisphaeria bacterium]|jgi:membrane fusion protein (multidrug efflux system)